MNFSSKFINEITGFKMKNLDIVYQQISVKYNIINSNNNVKYILQNNNNNNNKLYTLTEIDKKDCINDINKETGSCKYSYTNYGLYKNSEDRHGLFRNY